MENFSANNSRKWIFSRGDIITFVIVGIVIFVLPIVLTRPAWFLSFTDTGQIGDTIGGITAPFIGLLSAVLVYRALKAQIDANKIITNQFLEQKQLQYFTDQIKFVREDIDTLTFTRNNVQYSGAEAVQQILSSYVKEVSNNCEIKDPEKYFSAGSLQVSGLINRLILIQEEIDKKGLFIDDKKYLSSIIQETYKSKLYPALWLYDVSRIKHAEYCATCGIKHVGIPEYLYSKYDQINNMYNIPT